MAKNKGEIIRYANDEILGKGKFDVVGEIFAVDYMVHAGEKNTKGNHS